MECYANETGILRNDDLDKDSLNDYLINQLENGETMLAVVQESFETCFAKSMCKL